MFRFFERLVDPFAPQGIDDVLPGGFGQIGRLEAALARFDHVRRHPVEDAAHDDLRSSRRNIALKNLCIVRRGENGLYKRFADLATIHIDSKYEIDITCVVRPNRTMDQSVA